MVNGACSATHVLLPGIRPSLSAATSVFLPAKGTTDLSSRVSDVYVDNPTIGSVWTDPLVDISKIVGEKGTAKAVLSVVVDLNCLFQG